MKFTNTLLAIGLAALPASALALDGDGKNGNGDDAAALVQKLGDKDYKVRRDAYKQLEKLGADARAALETAAKSDDAEVRWNASRLLDHLDADGAKGQQGGLKERADSQSGSDEQDDDATRNGPAQGRGWRLRSGPVDLQQQMRDLEFHMQELQKLFDHDGQNGIDGFDVFRNGGPLGSGWAQRFGQFGGGGEIQLQPGSSFSRSTTSNGRTESFSLRIDQDGHVTAEEQKDGKTTKVEADSIEAFRKEHPEMLQRGPVSIAIRPFGQNGPNGIQPRGQGVTVIPGTPEPPQPNTQTVNPKKRSKVKAPKAETLEERPQTGQEVAPAQKPRLGVELAPVPQDVAEYLELDGDAFQIVRVMDDMPAAKRGLKPRDILLEVNGRAVHAFDDVVKALDGADPNAVKIVVLRRGQRKEL